MKIECNEIKVEIEKKVFVQVDGGRGPKGDAGADGAQGPQGNPGLSSEDVLFFNSRSNFPTIGQTDKVYISKDNGISWTWNTNYNKYLDNHGRTGFAVFVLNENNIGTTLTATYLINTLGNFTFSIQQEDQMFFFPKLYIVSNANLTNNKTFVSYVPIDNYNTERTFIMTESSHQGNISFGVYVQGNFLSINTIINKLTLSIEVYP